MRTKWGPFQQFGPHEDQVLNWGPLRKHWMMMMMVMAIMMVGLAKMMMTDIPSKRNQYEQQQCKEWKGKKKRKKTLDERGGKHPESLTSLQPSRTWKKKDMFIRILTIQIADPLCPFVIFDSCISGLQYEELRNLADIYAVKENENIFKSNPEHSIVGSLNVRWSIGN